MSNPTISRIRIDNGSSQEDYNIKDQELRDMLDILLGNKPGNDVPETSDNPD